MSRKINFAQVWNIAQKVIEAVSVIQSQEFNASVDEVVAEAGQVVTESRETAIAAAKMAKQILDVFQVPVESFQANVLADGGRSLLSPFEQEVYHLLNVEDQKEIPFD